MRVPHNCSSDVSRLKRRLLLLSVASGWLSTDASSLAPCLAAAAVPVCVVHTRSDARQCGTNARTRVQMRVRRTAPCCSSGATNTNKADCVRPVSNKQKAACSSRTNNRPLPIRCSPCWFCYTTTNISCCRQSIMWQSVPTHALHHHSTTPPLVRAGQRPSGSRPSHLPVSLPVVVVLTRQAPRVADTSTAPRHPSISHPTRTVSPSLPLCCTAACCVLILGRGLSGFPTPRLLGST